MEGGYQVLGGCVRIKDPDVKKCSLRPSTPEASHSNVHENAHDCA